MTGKNERSIFWRYLAATPHLEMPLGARALAQAIIAREERAALAALAFYEGMHSVRDNPYEGIPLLKKP